MMTPELWAQVRYFKRHEFDSRGPGEEGTGHKMQPKVVFMLDAARPIVGKPLRIPSGYRTPEHNKRVGGAPKSAHLDGLAVDISRHNLSRFDTALLVDTLITLGFQGIGIDDHFIHGDMKPRRASWIYVDGGQRSIPIGKERDYI